MIGSTVRHYEILEQLGSGGMGVVYKARDTKLNRDVALKFLPAGMSPDEEASARFTQEAQAASALDQPNICTIHEIGESDDGHLFIAMAYYEGQTLKYRLEDGPISHAAAESITRQLLEGLSAAHRKGIIHRDIKPANIMVTDGGRVKILDFGLAKLSGGLELTKSRSTVGTAYYMSPEQIRGEPVDERTDLWSVGVVLYQMLTGRRPFEGDYEQAIGYAILNESPSDLPVGTPPHLDALVSSLLQKNRDHRLASAPDALTLLDGLAATEQPAPASGARSSRNVVVGLSAALVLTLVFVAALLWPGEPAVETQISSDVDPVPTIAVLPFDVSGDEELEYLHEGAPRLLSSKLDALGELAGADVNSVLSFVDRQDGRVDLEVGRQVAAHMDATGFIMGSIVATGDLVRLSASLYTSDGTRQAVEELSARSDEPLIPVMDNLATGLLAGWLEQTGRQMASIASLTTHSDEALRDYLEAEKLLREGSDPDRQIALFRSAVGLDSTFSLAWYGMAHAAGWGFRYRDLVLPALREAVRHSADLPAKMRVPMQAYLWFTEDRWQDAEHLLRQHLRLHPADPEAWYVLAETVYHNYPRLGESNESSMDYFERAAAIDSSNTEYKFHLFDLQAAYQKYPNQELSQSRRQPSVTRILSDTSGVDLLQLVDDDTRRLVVHFATLGRRPRLASEALASLESDAPGTLQFYRLATGQFEKAMRASALPDEHLTALWIPRILLVGTIPAKELARMRRLVADWDVTANPVSLNFDAVSRDDQGWMPYRNDQLQYFTEGMLGWALRDSAGLANAARRLENESSSPYDSTLGASFRRTLRALDAWSRNDLIGALDLISSSTVRRLAVLSRYPYYSENVTRFIRAEILMALGRYQEAQDWYRLLTRDPAAQRFPVFIAPSIYKEAVCDEALGDYDAALENYRIFIEYWNDADDYLQPIVDEARAGIERVQAARLRESAG